MMYLIGDFQFDATHLNLYCNGEAFPLNNKPAQLLALMLEERGKIVSKDEIFERLWPHRDVTDQAIFQTVTQLRQVFGSQAIKTFVKKGYQWQSPYKVKKTGSAHSFLGRICRLLRRKLKPDIMLT